MLCRRMYGPPRKVRGKRRGFQHDQKSKAGILRQRPPHAASRKCDYKTLNLPVALTCGDPAGIGPEIIAAAWKRLRDRIPFFVLFDTRCARLFGSDARVLEIDAPEDALKAMPHGIPVLRHEFDVDPQPGIADASNAASIIRTIERAAALALNGNAAAVCTGPVSKSLLRSGAGFDFGGQTELLADICCADFVVMMLESPLLRVIPATRHCSISEVPTKLSQDLIDSTIRTAHNALRVDFEIFVAKDRPWRA